jgi:hypothetical protein
MEKGAGRSRRHMTKGQRANREGPTSDRNDITVAAEANRQSDSRWRRVTGPFAAPPPGTSNVAPSRTIGATLTVAVIADCLPEAANFAAWAKAAATTARPKDSYVWTVAAAYLVLPQATVENRCGSLIIPRPPSTTLDERDPNCHAPTP